MVWNTAQRLPSPIHCLLKFYLLVKSTIHLRKLTLLNLDLPPNGIFLFLWCLIKIWKLPLGNTNFRSADMWGLGCLIWEVFNGSLQSPSSLKAIGKVLFNDCAFKYSLSLCCNPSYFKFRYPNYWLLYTASSSARILVRARIPRRHKILPQLINAFEFGNAGSTILTSIFKVSN